MTLFTANNEREKAILDEAFKGGSTFTLTNIVWGYRKGQPITEMPSTLIIETDIKLTPENAEREFEVTRAKISKEMGVLLHECDVHVQP